MLKEKLSYSFAKSLLSKTFEKIKYELTSPFEPSEAMERGNRWEYCLDQESSKDLRIWTDTKTKGEKYKKWKQQMINDSQFYQKHPYLIVTAVESSATDEFLSAISFEVSAILSGAKYQEHVEFEDNGVMVHGYTDWADENTIYDLKITESDPISFGKQVGNMSWDLQAYIYTRATGKAFKWVAISPDRPYVQRIYECPEKFLKTGERKYHQARKLFDEFNLDLPQDINAEIVVPAWIK